MDAARDFIAAIHEDIKNGYGFVPFIGAGFSVTAGIPMILHLLSYLQRCICMVLGVDTSPEELREVVPRWNPRTDNWPPFIDRTRATVTGHWENLIRDRLQDPERQPRAWLYEHALGAMKEWRTALEFLSHVELVGARREPDSEDGPLHFCEPDSGIVDACFRQVMLNKRPSMNHKMLAALSSVLRIDLILTTNFDNLTETAFDEFRNPLTAFDVHLGEPLPDIAAVSRNRSIVKLHGSLRSLRADFTLEGLPTAEDRRIFSDYLADKPSRRNERDGIDSNEYERAQKQYSTDPRTPDQPGQDGKQQEERLAGRHLLMLGVAAREKRSVDFIKDALGRFKNLHVYWVCYSERDAKIVCKEFGGRFLYEKKPRVRIIRHTNAGLLFLHLYQTIRKSLPTNGTIFPSPSRLSIPPLPWSRCEFEKQSGYKKLRLELGKRIGGKHASKGTFGAYSKDHRLIVVPSSTKTFGLASVAAEVFHEFETSRNCLWLDMNDIHNADDLFEAFREAAFQRLNEADWTPLFQIAKQHEGNQSLNDLSPLVAEIVRIINSSNQQWVLFINAREIPGSNRVRYAGSNGWMDRATGSPSAGLRFGPEANSAEALCDLLQAFVKANDQVHGNRIAVVLVCYTNSHGTSHLLSTLDGSIWGKDPDSYCVCPVSEDQNDWQFNNNSVLTQIIEWPWRADPNSGTNRRHTVAAKCRFIQTLVSMQRPRHLSVAWARCMNTEWRLVSEDFDRNKMGWLDELEELQLVRRMDGGFIWLLTSLRQALRDLLALTPEQLEAGYSNVDVARLLGDWKLNSTTLKRLRMWRASGHQAPIHLSLATWYRKVLDATGSAAAVFEVVDHLCWSAESLIRYGRSTDDRRIEKSIDAAETAGKYIDTARELLSEHQFLIQTQGHPGATLRRLQFIRDLWFSSTGNKGKSVFGELVRCSKIRPSQIESLKQGQGMGLKEIVSGTHHRWLNVFLAIAKLQCTTDELARVVNREVAEDGDAFMNLRECGVRMVRNIPLERSEVQEQLSTLHRPIFKEIQQLFSEETDSSKKRLYEWIRWWRWCAMLGNASRSFDAASASSLKALRAVQNRSKTDVEYLKQEKSLEHYTKTLEFNDFSRNVIGSRAGQSRCQLEALHSLEVAAFSLTLRAHTLRRAHALGIPVPGTTDVVGCDEAAFAYATSGLELVEQIQNNGKPPVDHDFELHWLKARLLMIAGIASLAKEKPESVGISSRADKSSGRHAMTFLSDAAACLNSTTPDRAHSDLAIVELRRAEVRLHEAGAHVFTDTGESFEAWTYQRLKESPEQNLVAVHLQNRKNPIRSLRIVRARAQDAMRFLDRAEPILRERRRNVFWTTWYFERRLRAISFLVWASVFDRDHSIPIPYLGLTSAMFGTETEPDRLLLDALRMIRVDAYRMSMVLAAYASCTRALHTRLLQDVSASVPSTARALQRSGDMNPRLLKMYKILEQGRREIDTALKMRDLSSRPDFNIAKDRRREVLERAKLDPIALKVIKELRVRLLAVVPGIVNV